ncbi:MAG TPA: methyltransferase domain-containing protein [Patescibacteria group bacterium]|nr:methyltransferase domain-containing protein [Patescibacteria group bacterium]
MFGTKILETRRSKYNRDVRVLKTWGIGIYIQSGGLTQSGGIVEQIWKSTLKRLSAKDIRKILILGLGGGTVAGLIRKKYPNAKITGVEIDPMMIELGKQYLNLGDLGIDIKIQDANKFKLKGYDLVIIDTYLGDKYVDLFSEKLLKSKIVVFNRLFYGDKKKEALKFGKKLEKLFNKVDVYYPTANLMYICYNR